MGGRIAWLAAVEESLKGRIHAAVPYHGGNVFKGWGDGAEPPSERIRNHLSVPVMGHFGALDQNPSPEDMNKLMKLAGDKLRAVVHENAKHGFACKDSSNYLEAGAKKSWEATLQFLDTTLKKAPEKAEL
eukprot:gb/GFBE01058484.1/.p1 GENE.gb/GFBE01058484.1/~~gb/GFBE01058484.1/.p1  ORF type:complete len:130 (+),score=37.89 gb/GFBE01058484.1/:1-390(+)